MDLGPLRLRRARPQDDVRRRVRPSPRVVVLGFIAADRKHATIPTGSHASRWRKLTRTLRQGVAFARDYVKMLRGRVDVTIMSPIRPFLTIHR